MADDNIQDASSNPFFVRAEFPFVFIPTTSTTTTTFNFATSDTQDFISEDQTTTEFLDEKEQNEQGETTHDDTSGDKNDFRISQPKYSQLLKNLDFSKTRMVDVTNLLSDDTENNLTTDDSENLKRQSVDDSIDQQLSSHVNSIKQTNDYDYSPIINHNIQKEPNQLETNIQQTTKNFTKTYDQELNNEESIDVGFQKAHYTEEDDDTSKQATQNYDLIDNEKEVLESSKSNKHSRFITRNSNNSHDKNLTSIPRLNKNTNNRLEIHEQITNWNDLVEQADAFNQPIQSKINSKSNNEIHKTQQEFVNTEETSKQQVYCSSSSPSSLHSNSESIDDKSKDKETSISQKRLIIDDDLTELNNHFENVPREQYPTFTSTNDFLFQCLSNQQMNEASPNKEQSQYHHSKTKSHIFECEKATRSTTTDDTWLSTLEKLEQEHKERLENQQKQYEEYMHALEENMRRRFDEHLSSNNSFQESTSDSNSRRFRTHSNTNQYRPLANQSIGSNLSRSQSREDISNLRAELSAKHVKHINDLKLYYEHEIDELKNELNKSRTCRTSISTRQSMETIERMNNENIRLHNEMKGLRHSLKRYEEENQSLQQQLKQLHHQVNDKDLELKSYHRKITELEKQLNDSHKIEERQEEKYRQADRQVLFYREENEKIKNDLNLTKQHLIHLEERYRELENEHKKFRQQTLTNENINQHSAMSLNMPTSREYGQFTLTKSRYSSSTVTSSRDENVDSTRYISNGSEDLLCRDDSIQTTNRKDDYIDEKSSYTQGLKSTSKTHHSPNEVLQNHYYVDQMPIRDFGDDKMKRSEKLEAEFDELLKKKRDLESRINRIPIRGLTNTDRKLFEALEREIERVEQQISSVKLELRKMNILRTY